MANKSASFLGANTPKGFVSFFDELYNPYNDTDAYIIKGGPGTGKSSFMKSLAAEFEKRGFFTERVYCSSDPSSLDALIVPERGFSVCDGTAPHVMEPRFPGVSENIINLGQFWSTEKLRKNSSDIKRLFFENSLCHRRSSKYLAAAGSIDAQSRMLTEKYIRYDKIDSFCCRFIHRELKGGKKGSVGEKRRRFISAITPKGNLMLADTVTSLCPRVIGIDDRQGVVSSLITGRIGEGAIKNGLDAVFCHCPMKPEESEHLLIPEKGLAIIRINGAAGEIPCDRIIHTDRFMHEGFKEVRASLRFNEKLKQELINESIRSLKKAKAIHDELEAFYIDAMDFDSLDRYFQDFISKLFT